MNTCLIFFLFYTTILNYCLYFSVSSSTPLLLHLSHSLSTSEHSSSPLHLLKSSSSRSSSRFRRHHHKHHQKQQLSLPISSGSDYLLSLSVGSSSSAVSLYLDTGSDLVWFPCRPFTCILCESKPIPPSPPSPISSSSITVPCSSPSCSAAHSSLPSSDLCAISNCPLDFIETGDCNTSSYPCPPFYYAYGDGSLVAKLYSDSLSLPSVSVSNFTFGCAHTTLAEPIGVAGFGRGRLSLPAQLSVHSPHLGNSFSYCLVSHSFDSERVRRPSPLILGRFVDEKEKRVADHDDDEMKKEKKKKNEFVFTELLKNPKHPYFYSVSLQGISIGKRNIPTPAMLRRIDKNGGGGIVVDSGTTFTMLPAKFYNAVVEEFDSRVGRVHERADRVEPSSGMSPCYYLNQTVKVPALVLHFAGNGSSVTLPRRNYFYEFMDGGDGGDKGEKKRKIGCLMLMNGGDESELRGGTGAILGNYQQQGFEVVYDLLNRRVGFAKRKCASLWDTLNQD
ncbi:PREDICTED: probable aspartyl protease At4g16563 [Camelina sativa]|uniref:Probable aspartyl protease At4g16563 n=2 Tax=Camelina sativa TaxID=90675 RepID=A0ABM0UEU8_CAMSA|nr:PREDICTED: probable aspartyl protease At4g16563 [Camelina sativa]